MRAMDEEYGPLLQRMHSLTPSIPQSEEAELVGYVIPPPVIQHFIEDYAKNGCFTAFPSLGIEWQKLENPQMRRALGLKVPPPCPAWTGV